MDPASIPLSVIIPTLRPIAFNRAFEEMVYSLKAIYPQCELIVVDSSSEPETMDAHRRLADRFLVIPREQFDHGATRNLAAREARGDFLLFMTQDAILTSPQAIRYLLEPFANPRVALAYGRQLPRAEHSALEKIARNLNYPERPEIKFLSSQLPRPTLKTFFNSNCFACYRKTTFWEVEGFPEQVVLNEDMFINYKLMKRGYLCHYVPEATVVHSHDYNFKQRLQRYFDIGVSLRGVPELWNEVDHSEGKKFAWKLQTGLLRQGRLGGFLRSFSDLTARWLGFQLGLRHRFLPRWVKPRLSTNPGYFKRQP